MSYKLIRTINQLKKLSEEERMFWIIKYQKDEDFTSISNTYRITYFPEGDVFHIVEIKKGRDKLSTVKGVNINETKIGTAIQENELYTS